MNTLQHDGVLAAKQRLDSLGPLAPDSGNGDRPAPLHKLTTFGERDRYAQEFACFVRGAGLGEMMQRFTLTTGLGNTALLPVEIGQPVAPGRANPFRQAHELLKVPVLSTSKPTGLILPLLDAAAGSQLTEGAAGEDENDPDTAGSLVLTARTYSSGALWISNTLLLATGFDLTAAVVPILEEQKERAVAASIAAKIIADAGITQSVPTASTSSLTRANLVSLTRALPRRFRDLRFVLLSAQAYEKAEDLLDTDGHPVLEFDPQDPTLRRINGVPILPSDDFEGFGATNVIGACVSLLGFRLRDAAPRRVARMAVPARPDQTGLSVFADVAFAYAVGAVAKLVTPAA